MTSRYSRSTRCASSVSRSRSCCASDPHVAERRRRRSSREYEELPAVYDEMEAMTSPVIVHDELRPAGLRRPQASQGTQGHQSRARLPAAPRRRGARPSPRPRTCSSTPSAPRRCLHLAFEPFASIADARDSGVTIHTARRDRRFCAPRSRGCSAGRKTACASRCRIVGGGYGSKLYIKLEALVAALSMIARRPVKVALTMEEQFYQITKHPSTFRIKSGVDKDGRITARKCEVFWNGGAYADIGPRVTQKSGFVAAGPYDIENVVDRFLRALHQYDAVRRAARLRRAAARLGLREPHRHDGARAQARSRSSSAARTSCARAAARERHHLQGCPDRGGAGHRSASG